jgi:sialidase-1
MMMPKHILAGAVGLGLVSAAVGQSPPASPQHFLGEARFQSQELWSDGTGGRSIIVAHNGDVLVFKGGASSEYKRSTNGGLTWTAANASGAARYSNAVLDETNGKIFVLNGSSHVISSSADHGVTWSPPQPFEPTPDRFGFRPTSHSSMQAGITLRFGSNAGRLLLPARIQSVGGNEVAYRGYNYSAAVYSDDHGVTWHTSDPFPVLGTGEAALVELRDGRVIYNSREHMSRGNRFIATSHTGGRTWLSPYRDPVLPDGPRGTSYGCMGGLIRLPVDEYDILLYSNLDTDKGKMPDEVGGTRTRERERITVWASFNGGHTWPVKRLVFDGPSAYSNLGVGRAGTASQGKIFLMYDGGPKGRNTAAQLVVFNLSWLLNGESPGDFLKQPSPYSPPG